MEKFGTDVGGVIIDRANDDTDTSFFGDNFLRTTATSGAFGALRDIARKFTDREGKCHVYVVSKCGRAVQERTLQWLAHHRFHERTGIPLGNVRFCRKRHEKGPICDELGITHFIDDRLEVLSHLTTVPARFLFRPDADEVARFVQFLPAVREVKGWEEVLDAVLGKRT